MKVLQLQGKSVIIKVKNGWVMCPVCGRGKVLRLEPKTRASNLPVYCKLCGKESIVNIELSLSQCHQVTSA